VIVRFDERALAASLDRLSQQHRIAFAAACAERLMPAYELFAQRSGRGDPKTLAKILARLWDDLAGAEMTEAELQSNIDGCMKLIPQEDEEVWVPEQAAAEDAGAALAYSLRCRQNGRSREAAWSAGRSYEALDHYVIVTEEIDVNSQGAEARILAHPLVQAELGRQQRDLQELSSSDDPRAAAARLQARAKTEGPTFFGQGRR